MATRKYRPRFERVTDDTPAFRFQAQGDLPILQHIATHRRLTVFQLQKLTGRNIDSLRRRLRYLFQDGYLERRGVGYDRSPMYALGRKAKMALIEAGFNGNRIEWQLRNNAEISDIHREHTLFIGDIRIALEIATKESEEIELADWEQGRILYDRVYVPDYDKNIPVAPDAFFSLKVGKNEPRFYHFVPEADRATETNMSASGHRDYFMKLRAYWQWYRHERGFEKWGISALRVLTVTTSEQRRDNLSELSKSADDQKRGSHLFLFAFDAEFKANPLGEIWRCPQNSRPHSLLD